MDFTTRLAQTLHTLKRSAIREFARMARETPGCISLTLGEPDFDTPQSVRDAAKSSLDRGETHYIENNGTQDLRIAIAEHERARHGISCSPDEIIVTAGATEALFVALFGVVDAGDEVIIPSPAFLLYEQIVRLCRGVPVALDTSDDGFEIDAERIASHITPRTKAIILNSPNNPTGTILGAASLAAVRDAAVRHDLFVICDDVYRDIIFTRDYHSFAENDDLRDRIIVAQSFSKPFAMTGWRVGWLIADLPVKQRLELVHQFAVVSTPAPFQRACVEALRCDPSPLVETYRRRRDFVAARLADMGIDARTPDGAFYIFPSIAKFGMSSADFCTRLIREGGVALTPGSCFGSDAHARLSFCCSDDALSVGLDRLEKFVRSL